MKNKIKIPFVRFNNVIPSNYGARVFDFTSTVVRDFSVSLHSTHIKYFTANFISIN